MDITFACTKCGQQLVVDESGAGLFLPCPKCRQMLRIPAASTPVGTAPSESAATSAATSSTGAVQQSIGRDLFRLLVKGKGRGPYTTGQLQMMWTHGQIPADAKYRKDNEREWRPIYEISTLLEPPEAPPPQSVPPPKKPEQPVRKFNLQPKIPKPHKRMVVLGCALLGLGLLGFFGYKFYGRLSQKDPSALLKQHVATLQETYAGLFHAKIVECTYDMQKTDSLASPYIGNVNYTEDIGKGAMAKYKIALAFQDGAWVLKTVQRQFVWEGGSSSWKGISPSDDTASGAPFRMVKHALGL